MKDDELNVNAVRRMRVESGSGSGIGIGGNVANEVYDVNSLQRAKAKYQGKGFKHVVDESSDNMASMEYNYDTVNSALRNEIVDVDRDRDVHNPQDNNDADQSDFAD